MKLKTYRVKMTRIRTMEIEMEVKARNEDDAIRIVEADPSWNIQTRATPKSIMKSRRLNNEP